MIEDVQWFVGIDWATQSHRVCLLDADGQQVGEHDFAHAGTGLTQMRDWLLEQTKAVPGRIAVAIETPHGPVVEMLLDHAFQVFAINPKQLDRFRDRFTVAGAKDDSRDSRVLGSALREGRVPLPDKHIARRAIAETHWASGDAPKGEPAGGDSAEGRTAATSDKRGDTDGDDV